MGLGYSRTEGWWSGADGLHCKLYTLLSGFTFRGSRFTFQGSGFTFQGSEFTFYGSGFTFQGSGFTFYAVGFSGDSAQPRQWVHQASRVLEAFRSIPNILSCPRPQTQCRRCQSPELGIWGQGLPVDGLGYDMIHDWGFGQYARQPYLSWKFEIGRDWHRSQIKRYTYLGAKVKMCTPVHGFSNFSAIEETEKSV
jgi:hypothetical protein